MLNFYVQDCHLPVEYLSDNEHDLAKESLPKVKANYNW